MADDAGALLVRSGLVSSSALDDARAKVADFGGTLGEQLVSIGVVDDDALTNFYKQRLLVPQVNPNILARLPAKVVAVIPSEMAIELRAIPVSLDNDNNLTVAMSDPSDRHAVDEISFFTGAYVVRAVATQMQIAWCLAHYYGHVTDLGERLLQSDGNPQPRARSDSQPAPRPRTRGNTGKIEAARHKTIAPGESIDVARPSGGILDTIRDTKPAGVDPDLRPPAKPVKRSSAPRLPSIKPPLTDVSGPIHTLEELGGEEGSGPVETVELEVDDDGSEALAPADQEDTANQEITIEAEEGGYYEPVMTVELDESRPVPKRKRPAKEDPPELAARAGEVQLATGETIKKIEFVVEEPRIVLDNDFAEEMKPVPSRQVSGEVRSREHRDRPPSEEVPSIFVELEGLERESSPAIIYDELDELESAPVMLDRHRVPAQIVDDDSDDNVVVLHPKRNRPPSGRRDRITQIGIGVISAKTRDRSGVPTEIDNDPTDARSIPYDDGTRLDHPAAPPSDDDRDDTSRFPAAPPPPAGRPTPQPSGQIRFDRVQRAPSVGEDDDEPSRPTSVMSAVELDEVIPGRKSEVLPAHLSPRPNRRRPPTEDDDDEWGPPGTTIPPPLLGAVPGTITPASGIIPIADVDSAPLMVAPPLPPERGARAHSASEAGISRALESATSRVLELIHTLDHTTDRDQTIAVMIAHLAETHRRAGFFAMRGGALSLFAITPRVPVMPSAQLRLDRPSTLQDVVGTRLPYRGPMHDDASRTFLTAILGACPPEILLVPITVKERVVGVLFGDQRVRHTFDDQLALAARAAGMALESLLKTKHRR